MTTNSPRLRTHSHILVVCVKYADFLPGDLTRNYSPNLSDTKTILTHTRTTGSKSVWFTIQVFRTRGIETGVPQIRCVCVCVCARARGITYAYLTYVSSNAVHEDTRTVSLSELESILVSLRFMDADSVYKTKQVLVMIDVWKYCL
jgi:hypothetical protein